MQTDRIQVDLRVSDLNFTPLQVSSLKNISQSIIRAKYEKVLQVSRTENGMCRVKNRIQLQTSF